MTVLGGDAEPGGPVPPYEGRKERAEPDQEGGTVREGVKVGGATGPVEDEEMKAPRPADTPGGASASPSEDQSQPQAPVADYEADPGVGPSHVTGTPTGESGGA